MSQLLTTSDKEQKSCELTDIDELSKLPSIHSVTPSDGVISIVQCAERHLHAYVPRDNPVHAVASHRQHTEVVYVTVFGDNCIDNQVTSLVCQIVGFFLDVSLCQEFHIVILNLEQRVTAVRQKMTKLVLFKNQ